MRPASPFQRSKRILGPCLLILYAVLCLLFALPGGSRLVDRKVWNSPQNRAQFESWSAFLQDVGVDVSPRQLQQHLWTFTRSYVGVRQAALAKLHWLPEQLGFSQSWRMFSSPQTHPSRLWLELDQGSGYHPLYVAGSKEYAWRRDLLEHHRLRKLVGRLGRSNRHSTYRAFADWLAREVAKDFPEAISLRVSAYTWKTPTPDEVPTAFSLDLPFARAEGKFARVKVFRLSKYR